MKKFKSTLVSLQNFIKWKYQKSDIALADLNHPFVTEYEFYLISIQNIQHNSAMGNIKKLKKIVKQCVANEWIEKDPFMSFKIKIKENHRLILSEEELNILANKNFGISRLELVKDIFVFSCYTGLSYADVAKLTQDELIKGIDGETWIATSRTKTDTSSRIPLLLPALAIVEKYKDNALANSKGNILPTFSNQKMHAYLKEITSCCGIKKDLTFHCARHTFATTVTLSNGVPIETVGKMLGHKNLKTTQHYAKILDKKVSVDMHVLRKKYSSNNLPEDYPKQEN